MVPESTLAQMAARGPDPLQPGFIRTPATTASVRPTVARVDTTALIDNIALEGLVATAGLASALERCRLSWGADRALARRGAMRVGLVGLG